MDESVSVIKLIMRKLVERSEDNYCTLNVIVTCTCTCTYAM